MTTPASSPFFTQKVSYVIAKTPNAPAAIKFVPKISSKNSSEIKIEIEKLRREFENFTITVQAKNKTIRFLKTESEPMSATKASQLGYEVIREGKPGHGTIFIYGQTHCPPTGNLPENMWADSVVKSQLSIVDELIARGIKHIFVEGLDVDYPPNHLEVIEERSVLRPMYAAHKTGDPTLKQHVVNGCLGVHIYQSLHNDVFLHKTITPELMAKHMSEHKTATDLVSLTVILKKQFPEREKTAMTFIMKFFETQKDLDVGLTFGYIHEAENFAKYCTPDCSPAVFYKKIDKLSQSNH